MTSRRTSTPSNEGRGKGRGIGVRRAGREAGAPGDLPPVNNPDGVRAKGSHSYGGERDPKELTEYRATITFTDEEDVVEGSQLVEVSEKTHRLLANSCTRSVSNESRKRTQSCYKLPKVDTTRTPRLDHIMKTLAPQAAKSADKELARIQSFMLDSLAPVSAILENVDRMMVEDVRRRHLHAAQLIGNANAQVSHLRREKLVSAINTNLTPLVKEDVEFAEAAPNLFGPDFSKRAKDYLDQVKTLRSTLPSRHQGDQFKRPLFQKGHSSGRGLARGRDGGPSYSHRGSQEERQSRHAN